ncbi:MAG: cysteine synthase A [Coriobacteriia bacterium]
MLSLLDTIGGTPLIELRREPGAGRVWAKVEFANPGGSVKDRIALAMIEGARADGALVPGAPVVEATSGNTGIGLALVCSVLGHPYTLVMPESMSCERLAAAEALGAKVVLTDAKAGMAGSVAAVESIRAATGAYCPRQFDNPENPAVHERTTGPEIVRALGGARIDAFVAAVGTGGTVTGVGRYLKGLRADTRIVGVEPAGSPVLSGGSPGPHMIQGIGAGFVPSVFDRNVVDDIQTAGDAEAWNEARRVAREDGAFCGISSGAAVVVARRLACELGPEATVVTVLPDTGERYVSLAEYFKYAT